MKGFKKFICATLVMLTAFTAFAACADNGAGGVGNGGTGGTGGGNGGGGDTIVESFPDAANPMTADSEHYSAKTLHKVNVQKSNRVFVQNGTTEYKILYDEGQTFARTAGGLISSQISTLTGVTIPMASDDVTWSSSSKYIVLGRRELFKAAGLTMPEDDLGASGYYIKTCGDSVFIEVNGIFGYQQAAIAFLRYVAGYKMFSEDTIVFTETAETLPDMEIIEKPDFSYRVQGNYVPATVRYNMGFVNNQDIIIPATTPASDHNGYFHTSLNYFDSSEHSPGPIFRQHPLWLADSTQEICYTAHGNKQELDAMVAHVVARTKAYIESFPDMNVITFTNQDNYQCCKCATCNASVKKYGSIAAVNIQFVNRVAKEIDEWLEDEAVKNGTEKREVLICLFGYHESTNPPVVKTSDGYKPIDESVVCRSNVGVFVAPIEASFTHTFYDDMNEPQAEMMKGWGALTEHVFAWLYEPNYMHYLFPLITYDSMLENLRFCVENNAEYVWTEGQSLQTNPPCFNKFKEYFNSQATFNVNVNLQTLKDEFFEAYFDEAAEPMYQFFNELIMWSRNIENNNAIINGTIYEEIENAAYWPKKLLDHWMDLIDEAYAKIEGLRFLDSDKYDRLSQHIKIESIFPRFALLTMYASSYSAKNLDTLRRGFKADCDDLQIRWHSQNTSLDTIFAQWGLA